MHKLNCRVKVSFMTAARSSRVQVHVWEKYGLTPARPLHVQPHAETLVYKVQTRRSVNTVQCERDMSNCHELTMIMATSAATIINMSNCQRT